MDFGWPERSVEIKRKKFKLLIKCILLWTEAQGNKIETIKEKNQEEEIRIFLAFHWKQGLRCGMIWYAFGLLLMMAAFASFVVIGSRKRFIIA